MQQSDLRMQQAKFFQLNVLLAKYGPYLLFLFIGVWNGLKKLQFQQGPVPEGTYTVQPGKARIAAPGNDVTLVGISAMQVECLAARRYLADIGIAAEVIDPIWLSPLDVDTITASVERTGRLLVVDNGWVTCGAGAEIVAQIAERLMGARDLRVRRMGFAPVTCPTTPVLENLFYPNARTIAAAARDLVDGCRTGWLPEENPHFAKVEFKGPF